MMSQVYRLRYRRFMIWIGVLIVGVYLFSGYSAQRSWHNQQTYLYSVDFSYTPEMGQQYDNDGNLTHTLTKQEYVKQSLTYFTTGEDISYAYVTPFTQNMLLYMMPLVMIIIGFLAFFLDQKSQFNRFLFSLPFSRKRLYLEKLGHIVLPILLSLVIGIFGYTTIVYTMIPQPYFNAEIMEIALSGCSHFITLVVALCLGIFLGVSLGNALSATLFLALFLFTLNATLNSFYSNLIGLFSSANHAILLDKWLLFYPGKTSSTPLAILINFALCVVFLAISYVVFRSISMENEGSFLTVPNYRHLYFSLGSIISIVYLVCTSAMWRHDSYLTPTDYIFAGIFLLIVPLILGILIYFSSIKYKIEQIRQKKQNSPS